MCPPCISAALTLLRLLPVILLACSAPITFKLHATAHSRASSQNSDFAGNYHPPLSVFLTRFQCTCRVCLLMFRPLPTITSVRTMRHQQSHRLNISSSPRLPICLSTCSSLTHLGEHVSVCPCSRDCSRWVYWVHRCQTYRPAP